MTSNEMGASRTSKGLGMKFRSSSWLVLAGLSVVLGGCASTEPEPSSAEPTVSAFKLNSPAQSGIAVTRAADTGQLKPVYQQAGLKAGPARTDPFALKPGEMAYDKQQDAERVFAASGPFAPEFAPPVSTEKPLLPTEPQPYRRLEGIVVGDSVLAIIDMGDGTTVLIRPGQQIPNSEWRVASIDEEKAVLVRGGNVLPRQITVRLESPPPGMQPSTGFGGGGTGFGGPGGVPGMGPGGMPPGGRMPPTGGGSD